MVIDEILEKYYANCIILGKEASNKKLLEELKTGIHAEAFFEIIESIVDSYDLYVDKMSSEDKSDNPNDWN